MTSPLLEIANLSYAYPEAAASDPPQWALHEITLSLQAGSCLGIMGPSGAGKSTLAQAMVGIVPQSSGGLIKGRLTASGFDTQHTPVAEIAQRVGLVLEDPDTQFLSNSVEEEIAFGMAQLGWPAHEIHARLQQTLQAFDLTRYAERAPHQLSGGERQRVALASLLAMQPDLLVLDEPASRLDGVGAADLQSTLMQLKQQEMTLVVISNDVEWLWPLADQLLILDAGRMRALAPMHKLLSDRALLSAAGLRPPQLIDLADRLGAPLSTAARRTPAAAAAALETWMVGWPR